MSRLSVGFAFSSLGLFLHDRYPGGVHLHIQDGDGRADDDGFQLVEGRIFQIFRFTSRTRCRLANNDVVNLWGVGPYPTHTGGHTAQPWSAEMMSYRAPGEARDVHQAHQTAKVISASRSAAARLPGALILITAALLPNAAWIARDHTPWPWDQAWYGEVSVDLWFNLNHSLLAWGKTMLTGMNMKPPGIVWLGQFFVPLGPLCGSIENALLLSVLLTQAVTLYLIFLIGCSIAPKSNAVPALGVSMAATAQSFVGLSHQFFVEPLQALTIAWVVLIAVRCTEWPAARILLHLAAALLAGALAKATTPLYCFLPCLYIGFALIRKPFWQGWKTEWRSPLARALVAFISVATPFTAMWYAVNLRAVWQHVRDASSGEIALHYGFRASVGHKLILWLRLGDQSFLSPCLGWVVILAAVTGVAVRLSIGRKRAVLPAVKATVLLSALQCGLLLLMFTVNDAVDPRYMYPMLAFVVVIVMSACPPIASRAAVVSRAALIVIFAICGMQFAVVHRVALGIAGPLANQFNWLVKPYRDGGRFGDVERAVRMTSTVTGRYNIVGVEEPWLNANTASFFAAKHRLDTGIRSYFTSLGYAQNDIAAAVKRVQDFRPMYYITLDEHFQTSPPNFVNVVSLPMLKQVRKDPHFEQFTASSSNGVLVFRRH